jgi:septal ring factor EnvC (AmiA/AmiB activator)
MPRKKDDWRDSSYEIAAMKKMVKRLEDDLDEVKDPKLRIDIEKTLQYARNTIAYAEKTQKAYKKSEESRKRS